MRNSIQDVCTIYEGWLSLHIVKLQLPSGKAVEREVVDHPCGAAVLLYNPGKRTALLVSERRAPVAYLGEPMMREVVAGKIEDNDAQSCARREALEEAGVRVHVLEHIAQLWSTPASSTERVDYFIAAYSDADRVAPGGGLDAEQEELRVTEVPLAELWQAAAAGGVRDAKTFLLLQALRLRQPELFG